MNTESPATDHFEDRLLAAILEDFDSIANPGSAATRSARTTRNGRITTRRMVPAVAAAAAAGVALAGVAAYSSNRSSDRSPTPPVATRPAPAANSGTAPEKLVAYRLASASVAAPATLGRYVVLRETDTETGEAGQSQRTTVIDTLTGASTTYERPYADSQAPRVLTEGPDASSTGAWFAALPTDPVALRTRLLALSKQQSANAIAEMEQSAAKTGKALPRNAGQPVLSDDDYVYEEADTLLWSPLVEPELRSALYKVLAATGGYTVDASATDPSGRPAIAMTRTYNGVSSTDVTYESLTTGAVLAQVWKESDDSISAVYEPVVSSDVMPPNPYAK